MFMKLCVVAMLMALTFGLDNGLATTPQMGWNPWNKFGCGISEDLMRATADALVSTGLAAKGYIYLNIDDCWQVGRDNVTNEIIVDPKFPSGMRALADYVHSQGLKLGLYSDAGYKTCEGRPGSMGFEEIDARTYAQWDIDYLKYDNCNHDGRSPKERYPPMTKALMAQDKKIFFSMCEWGVENPHEWAAQFANSWRTTGDISDNWNSFTSILDQQVGLEKYSGPGGWNDPDMLEVGNGGMTTTEYQSHFALWALLKAPLIIGCDITKMSEDTQNILMNEEVIAVNQDSLGKQGSRVLKDGDLEVWATQVADNGHGVVVILFNRSGSAQNLSISFDKLDIKTSTMNARDLINKKPLGAFKNEFSANVASHGVVMVKLTANEQIE